MRVLITVGFLGFNGETDGVVTTYRNLLPFFVASGLDVDLVAYAPVDGVEYHGRVRIFRHRPRAPLCVEPGRTIDLAFAASGLARTLGATPYDIVQSSTPDPMGFWARRVAHRQGLPFLALYHTALADYAAIRSSAAAGRAIGQCVGRVLDAALYRYYGAADLVLAPSHAVRRELAAGLPAPVGVLGRGVDARLFHPREDRPPRERVRALYVGRLTPEKGLDRLIPIFAPRADVDLVLVGDGPSRPELEAALPRATFTGRLEGAALAEAYADADFFVFPSRTDTLGNVVLEAMASGLPVIVTDSMGPKELVRHAQTGFVTCSDDEMADAVDHLASRHEVRRAMGAAARAFAETRTWEAIFTELSGHYEHLALTPRAGLLSWPAVARRGRDSADGIDSRARS